MRTALLIGGTGPTGPPIVHGLVERDLDVTILHTGNHELDEVSHVPHLHGDVRSLEGLQEVLGDRTFDVVVATYGRLRSVAEVMVDRCEQFVSVGGMPAYRGYFNADAWEPPGLPVPTAEDAPTSTEEEDGKSYRIRRTEEMLFEHLPRAAHFRYPMVYGPRQPAPREWLMVRRIMDKRPFVILPDGGLTLNMYGYSENLARAILLAVDQPDAAAGQVFNAGDTQQLTLAQVASLVAEELDHQWEVINMPFELAPCTKPMVGQHRTTHKLMDLSKLHTLLGYTDAVPAPEAVKRTARWLFENPPAPGGREEKTLEDPFDYASEDALAAAWKAGIANLPSANWDSKPGYGLAYGGPDSSYVRPDTRI